MDADERQKKKGREQFAHDLVLSFTYITLKTQDKPHSWTGGDNNNIGRQIDAKNTRSGLQKRSSHQIP